MQLRSAEMRVLEIRQGPTGPGPFEARVQLRLAVDDAAAPSGCSQDWVRLTLDQSADWEDAAVLRGRRLREARY